MNSPLKLSVQLGPGQKYMARQAQPNSQLKIIELNLFYGNSFYMNEPNE
jgi:hypothetical protein